MIEEEKNEENDAKPAADEVAEPAAEVADEQVEAEAPAAPEAEAPAAPAPAAPAAEAEPAVVLTRKEQRKLRRSTHSGEVNPERGVDERVAERAAQRAANVKGRARSRAHARSKHEARTGTPPAERVPGSPKFRQGTVVSDRADKTITVKVDVVSRHPRYEKVIRRTATVHAHDERNEANAGDTVRLVESRPLSRTKRWRLVEVMERAR